MNKYKMRKVNVLFSLLVIIFCILPNLALSTEYPSSVVATINVGGQPIEAVLTSDDSTLFVSNITGGSISKIDTATNQVVDTLAGFNGPYQMVISSDDSKMYVSEYGVYATSNSVAVVDLATFSITNRIIAGGGPAGIVISDNNAYLYVTSVNGGNVIVIDVASETVIASISVGGHPRTAVLSRDNTKLYTSDNYSGNISVIDTTTNTFIENMNFGIHPMKMTVSLGGNYLYTANYGPTDRGGESTTSIINLESKTLVKTIDIGGNGPVDVKLTSCGSYLLVSQSNFDYGTNNNKIVIIDTVINEVVDYITVQSSPFGIALNSDSSKAYVANRKSNTVSVLSGAGCIIPGGGCGGQ